MSIESDWGVFGKEFAVQNILTRNYAEPAKHGTGFWLGLDGTKAWFIIDLGCSMSFTGIQLINTHNSGARDRSTKEFRYVLYHGLLLRNSFSGSM